MERRRKKKRKKGKEKKHDAGKRRKQEKQALKVWAEKEFEQYEAQHGVAYRMKPFAFAAKEKGKILGVVRGSPAFRKHISTTWRSVHSIEQRESADS